MTVANDNVETRDDKNHGEMDDLVKALTHFSFVSETKTDDLESNDIIKALADFSATGDADTTDPDANSPPTTTADQNNVITVSYSQVKLRAITSCVINICTS